MGTPRPFRAVLAASAVLVGGLGVAACGTSHASSGATHPTTSATGPYGYHATTTLSVPGPVSTTTEATLPPAVYVQTACRSFDSFSVILQHVPEYGSAAAGEIGGMADEVQQADQSDRQWRSLQREMTALQAYAASPAWGEFAKKVDRDPRYRAVVASCARVS